MDFISGPFLFTNLIIWIICLYVANAQGKKRTIGGGPAVLLTFFLSLLGLLIVVCFPLKSDKPEMAAQTGNSAADELLKWSNLKASGAITESEYEQKKR